MSMRAVTASPTEAAREINWPVASLVLATSWSPMPLVWATSCSAASAVRLVQDIALDNVGLNPDLGNLFRLHRPIEDFQAAVLACAPVSNYWHIKSYLRDEDPGTGQVVSVPAPMESGSINYRAAVKAALDAGFSGPFCVEHYGGDGLSVSAANARYLRRLLAVATGEARAAVLARTEGTTR